MSIINSQPRIGAAGQSTGQYKIERSLRFNSADSAYLNRTPGSAGNRKTWTWSGWVKRGLVDTNYRSFFANGNAVDNVMFWNDTSLAVRNFNGTSYDVRTTQLFRDPSAWYHLIIAMDTTQATASNRIKIYVNGVQVTAFAVATYPSQNYDTGFNTTTVQYLGYNEYNYFDGYMTEVNFIDGSAKTPSDFGETDTDTGVWKPKAYSGSYGTNGFYLKFADNSGTTSTTLGKDSSGNGNNWTPNNFSVTAGAGNDSLVDTPTPYGTDTGAGGEVRGNYATLNPLSKSSSITLANGNLDASTAGGGAWGSSVSTLGLSSGKWYFEAVWVSGAAGPFVGYTSSSADINTYLGGVSGSAGYLSNATKYVNGSVSSYGASYTTGDVIGVAVDMDAGTITCYKNNSSQGTLVSGLTGTIFVGVSSTNGTGLTVNFGQRPFAYTAPSGFKALCTQNLPTPTIGATATTRADDYFNTVLWTGTGASLNVTGVGFQPDFVWNKSRSNAQDHRVFDVLRGTSNALFTNLTLGDYTESGITSFNSDGFTIGSAGNTNGYTYVSWNWKANGAGSSNTAGSVTSTVSVNTDADFSIVTFTSPSGTGNFSAGHGLGVTPEFVIVKSRSAAGNWYVYHKSLATNNYLELNSTNAVQSATDQWGAGMTSSVIGLRASYSTVPSATTVAYCFAPIAGYSAFGKYTGNGSADGAFVYTGFRPKWILIKSTDAVTSWLILDSTRNTYNLVDSRLFANLSSAEDSGSGVDLLSNGFKLRSTSSQNNDTIGYIYAAFAEVPTKFSLAR